MLTKEEATQVALRTYEKYGHLTFALLQQQVFERPDNSKEIFRQLDVKRNFGSIKNLHEELGLEIKKTKTKIQKCKRCNKELVVSKYALDDFDHYCLDCKFILHNEKFTGTKDIDYVECPGCGYRAFSLEGHYRKTNIKHIDAEFKDNKEIYTSYLAWQKCKFTEEELVKQYGEFRILCKNSEQKTKNTRRQYGYFRDREKTIEKMSKSFLKHINLKGETKETNGIIKKINLTKKKHSLEKSLIVKESFEKHKNKDGKVKIDEVIKELKISLRCLLRYLESFNLKSTLKKKISKFQLNTLNKISKLINDVNYEAEINFKKLKISNLNNHLRFDGFFFDKNLLTEVHGYQHYHFPNRYHKTIEQFEHQKFNDEYKKQKAIENGFKYLEVSCYDSQQDIENKLRSLNLVTKEA